MSGVQLDPDAPHTGRKYWKGDLVHVTVVKNDVLTRETFTIIKGRLTADRRCYEYQLLSSDGRPYRYGTWVRENCIRISRDSKSPRPISSGEGVRSTQGNAAAYEQTEPLVWSETERAPSSAVSDSQKPSHIEIVSGLTEFSTQALADDFMEDRTRYGMDNAAGIGPEPFSDSGYASGTQSLGKPVIDASHSKYGTDVNMDDTITIYSDVSSTTISIKEKYISELAEDLLEHTPSDLLYGEDGSMARLYTNLPQLLKAFARKIAHSAKSQESRDAMVFISKHRHAIIAKLKECSDTQKSNHQSGVQTLDEKMENWFERENSLAEHPTEVFVGVKDLPDDEDGDEDSDEDLRAKLPRYRDFIIDSTAHDWLVKKLEREFTLVPPGPEITQSISDTILAKLSYLEPFRNVSRKRNPDLCRMHFAINWNPWSFFQEQEYEGEYGILFEQVITLTGTGNDAQATSIAQYLRQCWPLLAEDILEALRGIGNPTHKRYGNYEDGAEVYAEKVGSQIHFQASGIIDWVAEIGDLLAWLGAALQSSTEERKIICCRPSIRIPDNSYFHAPHTWIDCEISFEFETKLTEGLSTSSNGRCWHDLFHNPVVVKGYPIPKKPLNSLGVEIPLNMMAALAGARRIVNFAGNLFIKGFSTMLILIRRVDNICTWHLLFNQDGDHISYEDPRVRAISPLHLQTVSAFELESARHILGWCSNVQMLTGAPNANYNIRWSGLPKPHQGCAFEKVSISGGKFISAGISFAIGKKDKPVHVKSRDDYITQLKWIAKKFVVLYDLGDRRAWLVDGVSALLHLVRASLEKDQSDHFSDLFLFKPDQLKEADPARVGKSAVISVLTNAINQSIPLYKKPDDDYEEVTTEEDGRRGKVSKKKVAYLRFKDRVEQAYHLLEQIIAYQSQVDSEDGIGFRVKYTPRRQLEGFNFMDVATDEDPFWPRVTTILPTGKGWIDLIRAIHAVTLFGYGFGELLKPLNGTPLCPSWMEVPKGLDYLAASVLELKEILSRMGSTTTNPWQLVDDIYWHNPDKVFEACQCASGPTAQKHCDRVQILLPARFPNLWTRKFRSPSNLGDRGAVIFGHSWKFPLRWGDSNDPEEGQPIIRPEELDESAQDSGLGSSINSSSHSGSNSIPALSFSSSNLAESEDSPSSATPASRSTKTLSALNLFKKDSK